MKKNKVLFILLTLLIARILFNSVIPLMDKTEARYAEIARIMVETGDWITPQIDYGIPFWAKPPLSTWLSAISFSIFGFNEFAARLPYFLLCFAIILLIGKYAKRKQLNFWLPGIILLLIPEFLLHAGVVSTDTALAFCVTLVMISFWEAIQNNAKNYWKYLIYLGLGLGLLAKGPIIFILTVPPIFTWLIINKQFISTLKKLVLPLGILIICIIALPWYYLAEQNSPGFIDYFIIGEHFKRYFDSSWSGDKYGFPKSQPLGMIWIFLLLFTLPWLPIISKKIHQFKAVIFKDKWSCFLLVWMLWTPLFFTISKSLIHPYILPVMVPISLFIIHWYTTIKNIDKIIQYTANVYFVFFVCAFSFIALKQHEKMFPTDKYLIAHKLANNKSLYSFQSKNYSAQFYSNGKVKVINLKELENLIRVNQDSFKILVKKSRFKNLPLKIQKQLNPISSNNKTSLYAYFKN